MFTLHHDQEGFGSINDGLPPILPLDPVPQGTLRVVFSFPSLVPVLLQCGCFCFIKLQVSAPFPLPSSVKTVSAKLNKNYELLCVGTDREHILFLPIITVEPTGNQTVCSLQNNLDPRSESKLFYCKL